VGSQLRNTRDLGKVLVMLYCSGVLPNKSSARDDSLVPSIQRTSGHFPHAYKCFRRFLGSFTKLRKETMSFIMCVRPLGKKKPLSLDGF